MNLTLRNSLLYGLFALGCFLLFYSSNVLACSASSSCTLTINIDPAGGGTVTGGGSYDWDEETTVTATPNPGYIFLGWDDGGGIFASGTDYSFGWRERTCIWIFCGDWEAIYPGGRTLIARFELEAQEVDVTVSASPAAGGNVTGGGTYEAGDSLSFSTDVNDGYEFVNWTMNGQIVDNCSQNCTTTVPDNVTELFVVANFEVSTYDVTLSADPDLGGTVSGGGTFTHGTSVTVTAVPDDGFNFENWTEFGTAVSANSAYTFNISDHRTLVANFVLSDPPDNVGELDIANYPLFLGIAPDPNIMFIMDDSGSMHWEVTPDNLLGGYFVYPFTNGIYGSSNYSSNVASFRDDGSASNDNERAYARLVRSEHNATYYNPAITYNPWTKSDGTLYPNAVPTGAFHHPVHTDLGARNLTITNTQQARWYRCSPNGDGVSCSVSNTTRSFWPALYYVFNGGNKWNHTDYTKVEIKSTTNNYTSDDRANRTDCASAPTCTYDEEIQNFANWYTYYRSRNLAARAGIGKAFNEQAENMRVGYGSLNKGSQNIDGVNTTVIRNGVRPFTGSDRDNFYTSLYTTDNPTSGTPLRNALKRAGQYYSRSDNAGPWGNTPGDNSDTSDHLECRQSYTILMTDGYWGGGSPSVGNADNTSGSAITGPDSASYTYNPGSPFSDAHSDTLGDVAMTYWKQDLRPDLDNLVATSTTNPAFWQHMVTFGVGMGVFGTIQDSDLTDDKDVFDSILDGTITPSWPSPTSSLAAKIDDLLHAGVNGRGGFFSAANPDEFATELTKTLSSIAARVASSSSAVANSTRLDTDSYVFQARFDSTNWTGDIRSFAVDPDDGSIDIDNPTWSAATKMPNHAARNILTYDPSIGGRTFTWDQLNSVQQAWLDRDINFVDDGAGAQRLAYLRGNTTVTGANGAPFRTRTPTILPDIINSDPAFVGPPSYAYHLPGSGMTATEKSAYAAFRTTHKDRTPMLYAGSNGGMLHGFDASDEASGGVEQFAFVPNAVYPKLSWLTHRDYSHRYYVDGSPIVVDAYIDSGAAGASWKSVLLSTLGAGGRALFALDVTTPTSMTTANVLWEVKGNDIDDDDLSHMGHMIGQPRIGRVKSGNKWVAVVGNGYNSHTNRAALIILDLSDGTVLKVLDTGVGSDIIPNGLASPLQLDANGDYIVDYVYAGDLYGNMWKFDLTSDDIDDWSIAHASGGSPAPLFRACAGTCTASTMQPITTRPGVEFHPSGGYMIYFGTGRFFTETDPITGANPRTETFYGIRDYEGITVARNQLVQQTITHEQVIIAVDGEAKDVRVVSNSDVNYADDIRGWRLDLISPGAANGAGERVITNPVVRNGRIIFSTFIPDDNPCLDGGDSWLMEIDAFSGGRIPSSVFDINNDGKIDDEDFVEIGDISGSELVPVSGVKFDEYIKTPGILDDGEIEYKYLSGSSGNIQVVTEVGSGATVGRQSWRQIR